MQQKASNRFNALNDLLSIQKVDDESLSTLIGRVNSAITLLQNLTPSTVKTESILGGTRPYTLDDLYGDLEAMSLIRSLPPDYKSLIHSLFVSNHLSVEGIRTTFHADKSQSRARESAAIAMGVYKPKPEKLCNWCI